MDIIIKQIHKSEISKKMHRAVHDNKQSSTASTMKASLQKYNLEICIHECHIEGIKFPCNYFIQLKTGNNKTVLNKSNKQSLSADKIVKFEQLLPIQFQILNSGKHRYISAIDINTNKKQFANLSLAERPSQKHSQNSIQILILLNLVSIRNPNQVKLVGRCTYNLDQLLQGVCQASQSKTIKLDYSSANVEVVFTSKLINISTQELDPHQLEGVFDSSGFDQILSALQAKGINSGGNSLINNVTREQNGEKKQNKNKYQQIKDKEQYSAKKDDRNQINNSNRLAGAQKQKPEKQKKPQQQTRNQNKTQKKQQLLSISPQISRIQQKNIDTNLKNEFTLFHPSQNQSPKKANINSSFAKSGDSPKSNYDSLLDNAQKREREIWQTEKSLLQEQINREKAQKAKLEQRLSNIEKKLAESQIKLASYASRNQIINREHSLQLREKETQKKSLSIELQNIKADLSQSLQKNSNLQTQLQKQKQKIEDLLQTNKSIQNKIRNECQQQIENLQSKILNISTQYDQLTKKQSQHQKQSQQILKNKAKTYQQIIQNLQKKLQNQKQQYQAQFQAQKQYTENLQLSILQKYQQDLENSDKLSKLQSELQQKQEEMKKRQKQLVSTQQSVQKYQQDLKKTQIQLQCYKQLVDEKDKQIKQAENLIQQAKENEISGKQYINSLEEKIITDYQSYQELETKYQNQKIQKKSIEDELQLLRHSYDVRDEEYKLQINKLQAKVINSNKGSQTNTLLLQEKITNLQKQKKQLMEIIEQNKKQIQTQKSPNKLDAKVQEQLLNLTHTIHEKQEHIVELQNQLSQKNLKIEELKHIIGKLQANNCDANQDQQININVNYAQSLLSSQPQHIQQGDKSIEPQVRVIEVDSQHSSAANQQQQILPEQSKISQKKNTDSQPPSLKRNQQQLMNIDDQYYQQTDWHHHNLTKSDKFQLNTQNPTNQTTNNQQQQKLQTQLKILTKTLKTFQAQKQALTHNLKTKTQITQKQQILLDTLRQQNKDYKSRITLLKVKQKQIQDMLAIMQEQSNYILQELQNKDNRILELEREIGGNYVDNMSDRNCQEQVSVGCGNIKQSASFPRESSNDKYQQHSLVKLQEQNIEIQMLRNTIRKLEQQVKQVNAQLLVNKRLINKINQKQPQENLKNNNQNDKFYETMQLHARIEELEEQIFSYQSEDNNKDIKINQLEEEIRLLHDQLEKLQFQLVSQQNNGNIRNQNEEKYDKKQKEIKKQNQGNKNQLKQERNINNDKINEEMEQMKKQLKLKKEQINVLKTLAAEAKVNVYDSEKQCLRLRQLLNKQQNQSKLAIGQLQQKIRIFQERDIQMPKTNMQSQLKQMLLDKQQEINTLEKKIWEKDKQYQKLSKQFEKLELASQSKIHELEEQLQIISHNVPQSDLEIQHENLKQELQFIKLAYQNSQEQLCTLSNKIKQIQSDKNHMCTEWEEKQIENMHNQLDLQIKLQEQESNLRRSVNASNRSHNINSQNNNISEADLITAANILKSTLQSTHPQNNNRKYKTFLNSPTSNTSQLDIPRNQAPITSQIPPQYYQNLQKLVQKILILQYQLQEQETTISIEAIRAQMIQKSRMISMQLSKSKTQIMKMKLQHSQRMQVLKLHKPIDQAIKGLIKTAENLGIEDIIARFNENQQEYNQNNKA